MVAYTVIRISPPSNPAQQDDSAEAAEAPDAFESWLDWLDDARSTIDEGGGDSEDLDSLLAIILEHICAGGPDAVARKAERVEEVLRETKDSNRKIARQQREAREERAVESAALAERLDRITDAIAAVTQENAELKTKLASCEENLTKATAMLEKEISRERALRRLLDSQRSRPHGQRVASELAKRYAAKALESAMKDKTGTEAA